MKLLLSAAILAASHAQDDCPFCPDGLEVPDVQILVDPEAEGFTCGLVVDYAASLSDRGILETDCPIVTAWMGECCPDHYAAMIGGVEVVAEAEADHPTEAIIIVQKEEKQEEVEEDYLPEEATGEPAEAETAAAAPEPASIIARPESCGDEVYSCLVSAEPDQECAETIHEECMDTSSGCLDDASSIVGSRDLLCGAAECLILGNPQPICRCEFVINECVNTHLNNILSGEEVTSESGAALVGDGSGVSDRVCVESACCATNESVEGKARCFGSGYVDEFVGRENTTETTGEISSSSSSSSSSTFESSSTSSATSESSGWTGESASSSSGGGSTDENGKYPADQTIGSESATTTTAEGVGNETMPADAGTDGNESAKESAAAVDVANEEMNRDGGAESAVSKDPSGGSGAPRHGALVLTAAAVALTVCSLA